MKLAVVVARYNEDLDWLKLFRSFECPTTFYVYDKNDSKYIDEGKLNATLGFATVIYSRLPNLGREGHTFLEHIQKYYECFDDGCYTVFCQGNVDEHVKVHKIRAHSEKQKLLYDYFSQMINDATSSKKCISDSTAKNYDYKKHSATYSFNISEWKGKLEPAGEPFGPWFERLLGIRFPAKPLWWPAALFCVRNDALLKRPVEFYSSLQKQLLCLNPEKGHFLERTWYYILSGQDV